MAVAFAGLSPAPVRAADEAKTKDDGPLLITLGSYGVYAPKFEGSKRHDIGPWPIISWRNANDKEWLELPLDGIDLALIETDNFRAGPVGFWRWQRDTNSLRPRGFSRIKNTQIDLSIEAGAFAEYWPVEWLRTRIEAREAFFGASGLVANISSDAVWKPTSAWTFAAGPRMSVADKEFMTSYYGVDGAQSASSGLPSYRVNSGIRSYGAGAFAKYKISPAWTTQGFFNYEHLTGGAGDSPVIGTRGSREQYMLGLGLSYTFRAPWDK
jgi:MipA family protein